MNAKSGMVSGVVLALVIVLCVVAPVVIQRALTGIANGQAAAIKAQAQLVHENAVARQMDAATAAVVADTRAAHSTGVWLLPAAFGALAGNALTRVDISGIVAALRRQEKAEGGKAEDYTQAVAGKCRNCGGNIEEARPGSWQCPGCVVCDVCGEYNDACKCAPF